MADATDNVREAAKGDGEVVGSPPSPTILRNGRKERAGYVRLCGPERRSDAVVWWYVKVFPGGFVHARGGRVRTARDARHAIIDEMERGALLHALFVRRPSHQLRKDGSLERLDAT